MRRGTQGHVAAPNGPTRRLHGEVVTCVHAIDMYSYYSFIIYIAFHLAEGYYYLLKLLPFIKPLISLNFSRVGLSPTQSLNCR